MLSLEVIEDEEPHLVPNNLIYLCIFLQSYIKSYGASIFD